jgi:hypothetical protein
MGSIDANSFFPERGQAFRNKQKNLELAARGEG